MTNGDMFWQLEALSNEQVLSGLQRTLLSGQRLTAELVAHLGEVEDRRLHLDAACSAMFSYCVTRLRLSEDEACRRIDVARLARRFPAIFPLLARGEVSLSVVALLKPHLTSENASRLLAAVSGTSVQRAREVLAAHFPRPDVPATVRKLPEPRRQPAEQECSFRPTANQRTSPKCSQPLFAAALAPPAAAVPSAARAASDPAESASAESASAVSARAACDPPAESAPAASAPAASGPPAASGSPEASASAPSAAFEPPAPSAPAAFARRRRARRVRGSRRVRVRSLAASRVRGSRSVRARSLRARRERASRRVRARHVRARRVRGSRRVRARRVRASHNRGAVWVFRLVGVRSVCRIRARRVSCCRRVAGRTTAPGCRGNAKAGRAS